MVVSHALRRRHGSVLLQLELERERSSVKTTERTHAKKRNTTLSTNKVKIYVRLIDEGTEVSRPTEALDLGNGLLELLATPDYDSEDDLGV